MPELKLRPKTVVELAANARFLVAKPPLAIDPKAAKLLTPEARALLAALVPVLRAGDWQAPALERAVRSFAAAHGVQLASLAQPLRAALTGTTASPGLFFVMEVLGRQDTLERITAAVSRAD
jgi:glutamyl-tRNA synthetase